MGPSARARQPVREGVMTLEEVPFRSRSSLGNGDICEVPLLCPLQNFGLVDDYHGAQLERAEPTHSHRLVLLGESMQDSVRRVDGTIGIMFFSGIRSSLLTLTPTVRWSPGCFLVDYRVLLAQDLHQCYCSGARLCTTATMVASSGSHARH